VTLDQRDEFRLLLDADESLDREVRHPVEVLDPGD